MLKERLGLSSSALKMIAVITMLVDHIAAVLLIKVLIQNGTWELVDYEGGKMLRLLSGNHMNLVQIYQAMRDIGRIAFPIYCFMLVEGFMRTRNLGKYLSRMLLFALLSEIPFDLAFSGQAFYWNYQNVMFTLVWGLLAMYASNLLDTKLQKWYVKWPLTGLVWIAAAAAAEWMLTDYGAKGVGCIFVIYALRYWRIWQLLGGAAAFLWEFPASLSFIFIGLYNGKKGRSRKPFFYAFYPAHLLLLYIVSVVLGMGNIPAI